MPSSARPPLEELIERAEDTPGQALFELACAPRGRRRWRARDNRVAPPTPSISRPPPRARRCCSRPDGSRRGLDPFMRQHTPAWEAARGARVAAREPSRSRWVFGAPDTPAMGALTSPAPGASRPRDAQREVLDAAVAVRPVQAPERPNRSARAVPRRDGRVRGATRARPGPAPRLRRRDGGRLGGHRVGQC